jgi:DNA-binding NarL/FixJ family response regulator
VGSQRRIKVIVANTTRLFADGLIAMLRTDPRMELLAEVGGDELPHGLEDSDEPIVVLIECLFSTESCPAILTRMTQSLPLARALVVTRALDDEDLTALISAGAFGCLTPDCRRDELIAAIERVSEGEVLFPPAILMRLLTQRSRRERAGDPGETGEEPLGDTSEVAETPSAPPANPLAPRERQVLETLALGLSTEDVAERLGITVHTVRSHLKNVMVKLNVHSKLEAVISALRDGLIELPR